LLDAQVRVDRGVSSGTRQILVLSVGDVEVGLGISVLLGETEINHVDLVASLANAHQKVVGFDISVDEVSRVDVFDSGNELVGEQKHRLQTELSVAKVEQVFERRAATCQQGRHGVRVSFHLQQVEDHGVVVAFRSVPTDEWHTDPSGERFVDL
jgi:hypothetical protein